MKKVQHEKYARRKTSNMERGRQEKSATRKKCSMKKMQYKENMESERNDDT